MHTLLPLKRKGAALISFKNILRGMVVASAIAVATLAGTSSAQAATGYAYNLTYPTLANCINAGNVSGHAWQCRTDPALYSLWVYVYDSEFASIPGRLPTTQAECIADGDAGKVNFSWLVYECRSGIAGYSLYVVYWP